jgi:hypothetical protein
MPEIGLSGLMSGDGKRGVGQRPEATAPILDSTKGEVAGYSMTSSASASIVGGMSRPIALAVASGDKDVAVRQQLQ